MAYTIGIDVSTTATKVLLVDATGRVVAQAASEYEYQAPRPQWSEQDPSLWWEAAVTGIRRVITEPGVHTSEIQGIGLTGQMHGLVLVDAAGEVIRPAMLWNDQRTQEECDEIRAVVGRDRLISITGNDALTGFTAPKLLWVRKHQPDLYRKVRGILLPKDYVRFRLTGDMATDKAGAAGTLLMDLKARDWSEDLVARLQIDRQWLPKTHEGPQETGTVSAAAAEATGLAPGTPVVGGGGDQAAQAVGVGAVEEGVVAVTLGTSGVVFASTDRPLIDAAARLHSFCHAVPGKWHLMGVMLSAAGSLRWYRDTFARASDFSTLLQEAESVPAGSDGLLFLPYLTGERTPHPDPLARGAFVGLTNRHALPHLTRAVIEGVAYGLRDNFELLRSSGLTDIDEVRVSGGGAKSPLWCSIISNVLGVAISTVDSTEGAAFGAALLASVRAGYWDSVEEACGAAIRKVETYEPDLAALDRYELGYRVYRDVYPALKQTFASLART